MITIVHFLATPQFVKYQKLLYIDTAVSTEPMINSFKKPI